MKAYSQFHDGVLEGIWIDDEMVHVFVRTVEKARFTVVVTGVAMLTAGIFKEGTIILEVLTRDGKEITSEDIDELYDLQSGPAGADQASRLLSEARQRDLTIL